MNQEKKGQCRCPFCDWPLTEGSFCQPCNLKITLCPECQKPLPKGADTCPECGTKIPK
ncbi:MAG: double zinc ribbon domain-containing protein [bacterium]